MLITLLFAPVRAHAETLRIASWNIEHLVADTDRGCRPRSEADFQRVRDVIAQEDADIWLLQEIEGEPALARVFDPAEWVFHVEDRRPSRRYPECRNTPGQRLSMQSTVIVIRAGIAHRRLPDLSALDVSGSGALRHGVVVEVGTERPLSILNTHFQSGCFEGISRQACGNLFAQLPVLRAWFDAQSGPVLIGGEPPSGSGRYGRRVAWWSGRRKVTRPPQERHQRQQRHGRPEEQHLARWKGISKDLDAGGHGSEG